MTESDHGAPACTAEGGLGCALFQHPQVFAPRDLEIIDRVYEAAWASITARDPFRDTASDGEHQEALRKRIMDLTGGERIEFDTLYEKVFANLLETALQQSIRLSTDYLGALGRVQDDRKKARYALRLTAGCRQWFDPTSVEAFWTSCGVFPLK